MCGGDGTVIERRDVAVRLVTEIPGRRLGQLPDGDFYLVGLYGGKLLTERQMLPTGGKADNVPGTGSLAVLTGFESGEG